MSVNRFITIEGNIGAGKTSLSTRLSAEWGSYLLLEQFIDNPFLSKFYREPERYAFSVETAFLAERYRQFHAEFAALDLKKQSVVADYSFHKSLIFARQTLDKDELGLFESLFAIVNQRLSIPQLFVYLHTPIPQLMANIAKRGRAFERDIDEDYLYRIEAGYFRFMEQASGLRCLLIHTDGIDFIHQPSAYQAIKQLMEKDYRYGLTEVSLASSLVSAP